MLLLCYVKDKFLEEREAIKTKKHGFEVGRGCPQSLSPVGVPFLDLVAIILDNFLSFSELLPGL